MTALPGLDECPAGSSWTRQGANTRWPVFQSQRGACTNVTKNCPLFRQKPSLTSCSAKEDTNIWIHHSKVFMCTRLTWELWCVVNDHGLREGPWVKKNVNLPAYDFGSHWCTLSLRVFNYLMVIELTFQSTVKDKMKWRPSVGVNMCVPIHMHAHRYTSYFIK